MRKTLNSIHDYFIPSHYKTNEHEHRKARLLINTTLLTAIFAFFFFGNTLLFEMPVSGIVMIFCIVLFSLYAWLLRWGVPKNWVTHFFVFVATFSTFVDAYVEGGLYSFNMVWFSLGPVIAVLLSTSRAGWFWLVVNMCIVLMLGILQMTGFEFPMEINPYFMDFMYLNSYLALVFIIFVVTLNMEKASVQSMIRLEENNLIIEEEKKRSDQLIQNILPLQVIEELKETGASNARRFESVSVMFTDFVNFSQISAKLSPEELVSEIDFCFRQFDAIIERNGLEKIKTIGDAYLAVCGLPNEEEDHALKTVQAGLEIVQFTKKRLKEGGKFDIRVGIHSGQLVAGIVGVKKYAYDIWGDTVNTASRMESSSEPGKINISAVTYALVKHKFTCSYRGKIAAKNKGMLDMYFLDPV